MHIQILHITINNRIPISPKKSYTTHRNDAESQFWTTTFNPSCIENGSVWNIPCFNMYLPSVNKYHKSLSSFLFTSTTKIERRAIKNIGNHFDDL